MYFWWERCLLYTPQSSTAMAGQTPGHHTQKPHAKEEFRLNKGINKVKVHEKPHLGLSSWQQTGVQVSGRPHTKVKQ